MAALFYVKEEAGYFAASPLRESADLHPVGAAAVSLRRCFTPADPCLRTAAFLAPLISANKTKQGILKDVLFSLVEISGIEPLTS